MQEMRINHAKSKITSCAYFDCQQFASYPSIECVAVISVHILSYSLGQLCVQQLHLRSFAPIIRIYESIFRMNRYWQR